MLPELDWNAVKALAFALLIGALWVGGFLGWAVEVAGSLMTRWDPASRCPTVATEGGISVRWPTATCIHARAASRRAGPHHTACGVVGAGAGQPEPHAPRCRTWPQWRGQEHLDGGAGG
jgi:hypothetical protein